MNEDYLWDKSGEPDPQIQQLEEILGTLGYQPKPLQLPRHSTARGRYLSLLAIAASVAVALIAGGLWFQARTTDATIPAIALATPARPIPIENPFLSVSQPVVVKRRPSLAAKHNNDEAVAAKQQLMFALRIASEKLNAAYRRTQSPTQIKNQHRAG